MPPETETETAQNWNPVQTVATAAGLSLASLADALYVSVDTVRKASFKKTLLGDSEVAVRLGMFFGVDVQVLLEENRAVVRETGQELDPVTFFQLQQKWTKIARDLEQALRNNPDYHGAVCQAVNRRLLEAADQGELLGEVIRILTFVGKK